MRHFLWCRKVYNTHHFENRLELSPKAIFLSVQDLRVDFITEQEKICALDGLSFQLEKGEIFSLVGESGSGKTMTCLSILRLLPPGGLITKGKILFEDMDLLRLSKGELLSIRGKKIGMIFQEPLLALNPLFNIGRQVGETLREHLRLSRDEVKDRVIRSLVKVGMPLPERIQNSFPHQLSGGMRQRAMIAQAIACSPKLLLADEPTSALDVTIQAQILELFKYLNEELGLTILLITHDLSIVSHLAKRIGIIQQGHIVECGLTAQILNEPKHPYTKRLIEAAGL